MRITAFTGLTPACLLALALSGAGCQTTTDTVNTNTTTTNTSINSNTSTTTTTSTDTIDVREPDTYTAKLTVKIEGTGGTTIPIPPLQANVGKNGADSRVAVDLPGGTQAIYLDKGDKHYVILPAKKQYAELNPTSTGLDWQRLMTPGQVVQQLKKTTGVQKVGDDQFNGRSVTKYRLAGVAKTGQGAAGDVAADSFVYVDKDTGLPLHSETFTQTSGGDKAQSIQFKTVTEMSDISTTANAADFELPAGFSKIPDEQVRAQVDKVEAALIKILPQLLGLGQGTGTASVPSASPGASPMTSPGSSPRPGASPRMSPMGSPSASPVASARP
jgi:hypothetical protein